MNIKKKPIFISVIMKYFPKLFIFVYNQLQIIFVICIYWFHISDEDIYFKYITSLYIYILLNLISSIPIILMCKMDSYNTYVYDKYNELLKDFEIEEKQLNLSKRSEYNLKRDISNINNLYYAKCREYDKLGDDFDKLNDNFDKECNRLNTFIEILQNEIMELDKALYYIPGGEEFHKLKNHYENLSI